jgi:hypothetical protein
MDVLAYNSGLGSSVELGSVVDSIWVSGFKMSEDRTIQVSKPMNAPAPNLFDRLTRTQNFSFVAGRSFTGSNAIAAALQFMGTHAASVPTLADLQFKSQGGEIWLLNCGITKVDLQDKKSAFVAFAYTIIGGTWSLKRN